jgi:hypothetical protein
MKTDAAPRTSLLVKHPPPPYSNTFFQGVGPLVADAVKFRDTHGLLSQKKIRNSSEIIRNQEKMQVRISKPGSSPIVCALSPERRCPQFGSGQACRAVTLP